MALNCTTIYLLAAVNSTVDVSFGVPALFRRKLNSAEQILCRLHKFQILTSLWQQVLLIPDCGQGWLSRRCHPQAVWWWCTYSLCLPVHNVTRGQIMTGWKIETCSLLVAECNQIFLWQQQKTTGRAGGLMVSRTWLLAESKHRCVLHSCSNYNVHG